MIHKASFVCAVVNVHVCVLVFVFLYVLCLLALVHPLVQVYTIPKSGQLAYVGHVCNFHQKVSEFLSKLPTLPADMPFVKVRPRNFAGKPCRKAPFTVNVTKLRRAFQWLQRYNPYYRDVQWMDDWAEEWEQEDVDFGSTREDDLSDGHEARLSKEAFEIWMQCVLTNRESGSDGFDMGRRILDLVESTLRSNEGSANHWDHLRAEVARAVDNNFLRCATHLSRDQLVALLYAHNVIDLDGVSDFSPVEVEKAIRNWAPEDTPADVWRMQTEMTLVFEKMAEDFPVVEAGAVSCVDVSDDVATRATVVQSASDALCEAFGADAVDGAGPGVFSLSVPTSVTDGVAAVPVASSSNSSSAARNSNRRVYPRVDAPPVDQTRSLAIRENTPGYIARAFPKLFPHGTGDYHENQGGRTAPGSKQRLLSFAEWGRFVMTWHDGRFARHSRFRYWLLDTTLRAQAPLLQHVFLRTHSNAADYTLEDLKDPQKRRDLVSQMSTCTSKMPGSVGERRNMRQKLDGMVNQIEAETADQQENGGQGRIPGAFCTLTCPVYKWEQLFDVLLKSYASGSAENPDACEYYTQWKSLPLGPERDAAMRTAFYRLSVSNPAAVQWHCALKLEMALHLVVDMLTRQLQSGTTPGLQEAKASLSQALQEKLGSSVYVHDTTVPDLCYFGFVDDYLSS